MKWIILGGIAITFGLVVFATSGSTYTQETKVVETEVDQLDKRIEQAQAEAKAEIETKAQSAYDNAYTEAMREIELEVTTAYRKELEQRELELAKDVESY